MQVNLVVLIPLLAPVLLLVYALLSVRKGKKAWGTEFIGLPGIPIALISALLVYQNGTFQSAILGVAGLGFSIRLDALSVSMLTMISLLGFVILKFSTNYMDGDPRKSIFFSRLAATIASVELLVLSGNLFQIFAFWVITSVCLHYLLVFYRTRPQAIAAARKKFIVARIGDFSLLGALVLIYVSIGTGDLALIFESVQSMDSLGVYLTWATILLVIAAVLKSAQFPSHGWLIEVVETPTPVSALLHAGLLNAGPFLMVRLGYLMIESTPAAVLLIIVGGFTALFASVVYLTQPSIKVALGYSSVAHMGFSLLICGFGVYSAAILHVVAHSFYKAHSFLSSGSVVDYFRSRKMSLPPRKGHLGNALLSIASSLAIYALFCYLWGIHPADDFSLMAVGAIIVMGISQLLVNAFDTRSGIKAITLSTIFAFGVALSFFTLESGAKALLQTQIPNANPMDWAVSLAAVLILASFSAVIFIQLLAPRFNQSSVGYKLGVHLRNGLYANVIFDRMIGSLKNDKFKWANLEVKQEEKQVHKVPVITTLSTEKLEVI